MRTIENIKKDIESTINEYNQISEKRKELDIKCVSKTKEINLLKRELKQLLEKDKISDNQSKRIQHNKKNKMFEYIIQCSKDNYSELDLVYFIINVSEEDFYLYTKNIKFTLGKPYSMLCRNIVNSYICCKFNPTAKDKREGLNNLIYKYIK